MGRRVNVPHPWISEVASLCVVALLLPPPRRPVTANMAEVFEELLCNFDTGESTMEITTVLLVGWGVFCVLLVALGRYISRRFLRQPALTDADAAEPLTKAADDDAATAAAAEQPAAAATAKVADDVATLVASAPVKAARSGGGGGGGSAAPAAAKVGKASPQSIAAAATGRRKAEAAVATGLTRPSPTSAAAAPIAVQLRDVASVPTATGADKDSVRWVNALLKWLYVDPTPTPELQSRWIDALNGVAKRLAAENGVQLQFQDIDPNSSLPVLTNVMADPNPDDNIINILSDAESTKLSFIIHVTRQMGENFWATEYTCDVETLSGPLSAVCEPDRLHGTVHFDCRPKIKLALAPNPRTKMDDPMDEQALQSVVNEIVSNALTHTAVEIDVSNYSMCPRYARTQEVADPIKPIHYDSMMPSMQTISPKKMQKKGKRLFVKVIKAQNLGSDKGCNAPVCTAELDEPAQKHATVVGEGKNPFWDEHFLYELGNETGEILFEIWDKRPNEGGKESFMGLGIVSVDDLLRNPSQRQIIPLQSRPYEGDDVSGALTVEFVFMESVEVPKGIEVPKAEKARPPRPPPPSPVKMVDTNRTVSADGSVVTKTMTLRKPDEGVPEVSDNDEQEQTALTGNGDANHEIIVNGEDTLTSTALRELSRPSRPLMTTEKSTLIIHSVQREVPQQKLKVEKTKSGTWQEVTKPGDNNGTSDRNAPHIPDIAESAGENERSRPKERKSFMSTLKKRLSFRNKRSRSVDQQPESSSRESSASRSASVDRAQSLPGSRADNLSSRSSLSEMSGVSSSSGQTYIDEASMLVVEAIENGITKHYLIPGALASKSKWRKKGVKLHIYNDHTFIAKHLPSNIVCNVCMKPFIRRLGKQGYECRDCLLKCHKPCHVKTDVRCPSSQVCSMELDYVQEPLGELLIKKTK